MKPPRDYPRDLFGYGRNPPDPRWPGGARVALQFVAIVVIMGVLWLKG